VLHHTHYKGNIPIPWIHLGKHGNTSHTSHISRPANTNVE
jgi:hypothetical protein